MTKDFNFKQYLLDNGFKRCMNSIPEGATLTMERLDYGNLSIIVGEGWFAPEGNYPEEEDRIPASKEKADYIIKYMKKMKVLGEMLGEYDATEYKF